ncbi:MAG: Uma2 family endonuclease [Chloroflexota bacterium]|nr:Uma2 family endonuclease [Chloroflexota bacterium]
MAALKDLVAEVEIKPLPRRRMTEDEFVAWCDEDVKAEWVDGEVIVHSPANIKHVRLDKFLLQVLDGFVTPHDLGEVIGPEFQIRLGALRRRRVPDILFVAKERLDILKPNHVEGAPDLVMEIVSPDSLARDWRDKYLEYEAAGVREYWIIEPMAERVEAYTLGFVVSAQPNGEDKHYARIDEEDDAIHSTALPGFYLKPAWLWQDPLPKVVEVLRELKVSG